MLVGDEHQVGGEVIPRAGIRVDVDDHPFGSGDPVTSVSLIP
jgi:hypothetical protein